MSTDSQGGFGALLGELRDPSRSERLRRQQARCQSALQGDGAAVLQYFKDPGGTLEHKKALLSAVDELDSHIKYDPLMEEVEHLKLEESELKELHSALQEEESLQLFLEKVNELQLWLHMLRVRQLPEPEPLEIHPGMEKVLQDTCMRSTPQIRQVHEIHTPKLHLAHKSQQQHLHSGLLLLNLRLFC